MTAEITPKKEQLLHCLHGAAVHLLDSVMKQRYLHVSIPRRYIFSAFPRQLKLECWRTDAVMLHKFITISCDIEHVSIAQDCFIGVYQKPHIIVLNCYS